MSFVGSDRQWFTSPIGLAPSGTRRDLAFCSYAINGRKLFVVEDASQDIRFRDNPLVAGEPNVRFYAGMPLITSSGLALGALCVLDTVARPSLSAEQTRTLEVLAGNAARVLNLRSNATAAVYAKAVDMISDGVTIAASSPSGLSIIYANESFLRFTGYQYYEAVGQPSSFPYTSACASVERALEEACSQRKLTTAECRFRKKSGEVMWDRLSFVPYINEHSDLVYMVALHRDISLQKDAEVQTQQLHAMRTTLATVDHVVKNFMNTAQLYSLQAVSGTNIDADTQESFDTALQSTRKQLVSLHGMLAFKDRATPFGISLLDHEDNSQTPPY